MSDIRPLTQFDFYHVLEQSNDLSLVYFSAAACSSCKHLNLILTQLAADQPALSIFKVNAEMEPGLVSEYEVFHLPALFLFKDGHYHAELHCEARLPSILSAIQSASEQPAQEAP